MNDQDDMWDYRPLKRKKIVCTTTSINKIIPSQQRLSNDLKPSLDLQFSSIIDNDGSNSSDLFEESEQNEYVDKPSSKSITFSQQQFSSSICSNKIKAKTEKSSKIRLRKNSTNECSVVSQRKKTATKTVELTKKNSLSSTEEKHFLTYCPICQISFADFFYIQQNIQKWSNHLSSCFDKFPKKQLKECPHGIICAVKEEQHYRNFQHHSLALSRANVLLFKCKSSSPENGEKKYSMTEEFFKERNNKGINLVSLPISQGTPVKSELPSLTSSYSGSPLQHIQSEAKKTDIEAFRKLFSPDPFKTPPKNLAKSPAKSTLKKISATKSPKRSLVKSPAKSIPKMKSATRSPLLKDLSQQTLMYDSNKKALVLTPQKSPAQARKPSTRTPEKPECPSMWESLSVRKASSSGNNSSLLSALTKEDSLSSSSNIESGPNLRRNQPQCPFALNIDNCDSGFSEILPAPIIMPSESLQLSVCCQSNSLTKLKSDKSYVTALFLSSDSEDDCDFQKEITHTKSTGIPSDSEDNLSTKIANNLDFPFPNSNETSASLNIEDSAKEAKSSSTCESHWIHSHNACSSELKSEYSLCNDGLRGLSIPVAMQSDNPSKNTAEFKTDNHLFSKCSQSLPVMVKSPFCTPSKLQFHNLSFTSPSKSNMKRRSTLKANKSVASVSTNQMQVTSFFTRKILDDQLTIALNEESNTTIEIESKPLVLSKPASEKKPPSSIEENPRPVMELEQFKKMFSKKSSSKTLLSTCESQQLPRLMPETQSIRRDNRGQQFSSCPFYKKISDTAITVDAFKYGSIPGCQAYFLSHFHYDHYQGITKHFKQSVYCSQVTANLLKVKIGIPSEYLHPLPLYCPVIVEGVKVTLLDANHCPGAVLMLFKTKYNEVILHTGDFRADSIMEEYADLKNVKIHQLFLDTTYCHWSYAFPSQKDVLDLSVFLSVSAVQENPKTLIVVGSYTIGKEKVFLAIAEAIKSKIGVTKEKKKILDCQENSHLNRLISVNLNECQVHVVKMNSLNYKALSEHLVRYKNKFDRILAFKPTGWTHSDKNHSLSDIKPYLKRDNIILYGIPYSEHSSFIEMKRFVQFVRPEKIIPTVNNATPSARKAMKDIFKSWLSGKPAVINNFFPLLKGN